MTRARVPTSQRWRISEHLSLAVQMARGGSRSGPQQAGPCPPEDISQ